MTNSSGEQLSNLVVSRKRKAWEGLHAGGSKGGPGRREEEEQEEGEEEKEEEEGGGSGEEGGSNSRAWEEEEQEHNQAHFTHPRPSHHHLLSPLNTNFVHEEVDDDNKGEDNFSWFFAQDIDADNLAADFDGSFTGLGVDINTTNYSMSEAMLR